MAKTDLKDHTAWNHLRATERASQRVSSWPVWKRDATLFREPGEQPLVSEIQDTHEETERPDEAVRKIA